MESNGKILSNIPNNGALFQNGSNKSARTGAGSSMPEQTGKVFIINVNVTVKHLFLRFLLALVVKKKQKWLVLVLTNWLNHK